MQLPLAELVIMLFFLSCLTILSRSRERMMAESRSSYLHMYAGLLVINLIALLRLSDKTGLAASIPFLSDAPFMQLTQTIGLVTGLVMLVSGVSDWLPLNRMLRDYGSQRVGRLELLKEVQQLISVEGRLPVVISSTLKNMVEHLPADKGICWQFASGDSGCSTVTAIGLDEHLTYRLASQVKSLNRSQFESKNFDWNSWLEKETGLDEQAVVLPVRLEQGLTILYALYCEDRSSFRKEDMQILRMVGDLLTGYMAHERDSRHLSYMHRVSSLQNSITSGLNHLTTTKEKFTFAANKLKSICKADVFSMISLSSESAANSYTLERTGFCNQKSIERNAIELLTQPQMNLGPRLMTTDETDNKLMMSYLFGQTDITSAMTMPLQDEKGLHGILAAGQLTSGLIESSGIHAISQMRTIFTNLVKEEQFDTGAKIKQRRLARLVDFQTFSRTFPHPDSLFQHAAGLLSEELGCEMVRISTFEEHGAFLKSRALRTTVQSDRAVPSDGYQVLSIMPNHRLARQTGRALLINQDISTQKMTDGEASQLYKPELKSVLLVPFGKGTQIEGVISVADCRNWSDFHPGEEELVLATGIAGVLTNVMAGKVSDIGEQKPISRRTLTLHREKENVPHGVDSKNLRTRYIPSHGHPESSERVIGNREMQTTGR